MAQKRIVHLRVYRGKELNYDANGNVKNESHLIKCREHTAEFNNHLKYLHLNGYAKVDVEAVYADEGGKYAKIEAQDIVNQVVEAFYKDDKLAQADSRWKSLDVKEQPVIAEVVESTDEDEIEVPELPEGKSLDDLNYNALKKLFPNVAELKPQGVKDFRAQIRATYPDQY